MPRFSFISFVSTVDTADNYGAILNTIIVVVVLYRIKYCYCCRGCETFGLAILYNPKSIYDRNNYD
jgi:hypothetical protein